MLGSNARVFDDDDVLKLLRSRIEGAGGQTAFTRQTGVERSHLNMVLNGKRRPSPSILEALNLRIVYTPVGRRPGSRSCQDYPKFPANREKNRKFHDCANGSTSEVTKIHGLSSTRTMEPAYEQGIEHRRNEQNRRAPPAWRGAGRSCAGCEAVTAAGVCIMTNLHHQPTTGEVQSAEQLDLFPSLRTELKRWTGR